MRHIVKSVVLYVVAHPESSFSVDESLSRAEMRSVSFMILLARILNKKAL